VEQSSAREALDHLEEPKELISFSPGRGCLAAADYLRAQVKFKEALRYGLPVPLEYRAHCELRMVYVHFEEFALAKNAFEKCAESADLESLSQAIGEATIARLQATGSK
jgi:hypothetical protein